MEEIGFLRKEDELLLARELGCDVEIKVTGFATPAQSPSPAQQGFQLGHQGLALFVKDNQRRNYYITVIDLIQQAKVVEVRVTSKLAYWKNPRQTRCHSIKNEDGGTIGVIFTDQRKADLFYDTVTGRIDILKEKIAGRKNPSPPSTAKPRNLSLNGRPPQLPLPSLKPSLEKPRPNRSPSGSVSPATPPLQVSSRPEWEVQARPPRLPSPANKPRRIAKVNPFTTNSQTTDPTLFSPTTPPISPSMTITLTTPTEPTNTLTTPHPAALGERGPSPPFPSTTVHSRSDRSKNRPELLPSSFDNPMALGERRPSPPFPSTTEHSRSNRSKNRPELLPPSFDSPMACPKDAATPKSGLFKVPRRKTMGHNDIVAEGPKEKKLPLLPRVAKSTTGGMPHRTHHNGGAAGSIRYRGERPSVPMETVPSHNPPSTLPNKPVYRIHAQTLTNVGQFRLPALGPGWNGTSSSPSPTVVTPPISRSVNPVTTQPPTTTHHLQDFRYNDAKPALSSQQSREPQHQSTSSYTPSWTPLASQESRASPNPPSMSSASLPWAPAQSRGTESRLPCNPSPPPPSWAPAQSRGTESCLPGNPPPLPPIEKLTIDSDSEDFPPPPPPENNFLQPQFNGVEGKPQHQNTAVQSGDPLETMLHSIRSNNPLARLRKVSPDLSSPRPAASGGGNNMISSLEKELLKRKKVIQDPIYMGEVESDNEEWDEE